MTESDEFRCPEIDFKGKKINMAPFCKQFRMLLWRSKTFAKRDPQVVKVKFAQTIFMGVLVLILYSNIGGYNKIDLQNMAGCIFFVLVSTLMNNYFGTILTFQLERPVFLRETANKMYNVLPYFITKNMIELPVTLITPLVLLLIIFWGIKFTPGAQHFGMMYLTMLLLAQVAVGLGLSISASFDNITSATSRRTVL